MKKLFFISVATMFALASCLVSCENPATSNGNDPADPTDPVDKPTEPIKPAEPINLDGTRGAEKVAADNAFAFELFRRVVATADDPQNAFVSPLSLTMALGMLYNGTSPEAGTEMAEALGVGDFSPEQINEYYQTMRRALLAVDPLTALSIANSIWTREGYPVKPTFYELNREYYDAEVQNRDFDLPATVDQINQWCADNTNGKITKMLDRIPRETVMYLINAVYFNGRWKYEFDKEKTYDEPFALAGGGTKTTPMMNQTASLPYYEDETLQCVELPYGNGAFSMLAMLPVGSGTLDGLVAGLDAEKYNAVVSGLQEREELAVKLPRWKQECDFLLNDPVNNLGISRIFAEGNLTGVADDVRLVVSMIRQKTFVEVNEQGTEAAAVTIIGMETTALPSEPVFFANRPFLYLIRERSTGAILFLGRMDSPEV
ncbi:MAG: serpin family protein [Alistipes sp.]|jgi:serpin B|nr:serpin family protein [Alistipes sp.]